MILWHLTRCGEFFLVRVEIIHKSKFVLRQINPLQSSLLYRFEMDRRPEIHKH